MKQLFTLFSLMLILASCKKETNDSSLPDPKPTVTLSRSFFFPNQQAIHNVNYSNSFVRDVQAGMENNEIFLSFSVPPSNNMPGESVVIYFGKEHLQQGLQKTYYFNSQDKPKLNRIKYTYIHQKEDGSNWKNMYDSKSGLTIEGHLTIEEYNRDRRLLRGSYVISLKNLSTDPMKENIGTAIDPKDQCDVSLSGTFSNLKLSIE